MHGFGRMYIINVGIYEGNFLNDNSYDENGKF